MQLSNFRIGLRTVKTGLSVGICLLLFGLLHRGNPMIACLSAAFSLRQDWAMSISFGKSRILGNTIGGGLAIVYFLLSSASGHSFAVEVVALPILVILCIVFSNGIKNNNGIIASLAALLMISLNIPGNETLSYAFERVLDTFIGTFVAILMNVTLKRAPKKEEESIDREIERLKEEEKTLRKARKLLEGKVQEGE